MNDRRPSLADLRRCAQKGRHREIGNFLARRVARPTAIYGSWLAVRLGLSAHQVTLAALASSLAGAVAIGGGTRTGFVLGVALLHFAFWLDHVDGQVARWRGTAGLDGVYLDYLMHHAAGWALGFALGYGLAARTGEISWTIAGFAVASGWGFLNLHNDCRYKAFFQRLKSTQLTFQVAGGSGGRPSPAPPPPRPLSELAAWVLYKVCEGHVVLIGLTGLAGIALVSSTSWERLWMFGTAATALIAPTLAILRIGRSIRRRAVESEFSRWFHPVDVDREGAET